MPCLRPPQVKYSSAGWSDTITETATDCSRQAEASVRQPLRVWEKGNRVPKTWSIDAPCVMVEGGIWKGWGLPGDSFPNGQGPPLSLLALNGRRWLQTSHVYLYNLTEAKQRRKIPLKDYAHRALWIAHPIHLYLSEDKTGELFKSIKRVRFHWHIHRN